MTNTPYQQAHDAAFEKAVSMYDETFEAYGTSEHAMSNALSVYQEAMAERGFTMQPVVPE